MSRNIRLNFKHLNTTTFMKTISKQNTDTQLDFELSSFQTSNNFSKKNSVVETNTNTYTNSNNTSKHCTNSKLKSNNHKNNIFKTFSIFGNITNHYNKSHSKYLQNNNTNYLFQNNSLNKENHSFSQIKKRIKTKTKDKINPHCLHFKPSSLTINKFEYNNSLNTSKNSKIKNSKEKKRKRSGRNFSMKKN